MADLTKNYKLKCPAATDFINVTDFNDNFISIDKEIEGVDEKAEKVNSQLGEKANKNVVTQTENGIMSSTDKAKLDNIATNAEVNVQSDWGVSDTKSDAYIKNKPTSMPANGGTAKNANILNAPDVRATNQAPQWYYTNYSFGVVAEFKQYAAIGVTGVGSIMYCQLITQIPYEDASGGYPMQTASDGINTFKRVGTSPTTWGAWRKTSISYSTSIPSSLAEGEVYYVYE